MPIFADRISSFPVKDLILLILASSGDGVGFPVTVSADGVGIGVCVDNTEEETAGDSSLIFIVFPSTVNSTPAAWATARTGA